MQGYKLEFKRNCDCETLHPVQKLVQFGRVDGKDVMATLTDPSAGGELSTDDTPRSKLERVAAQIQPPRRGQDPWAPIDGVTTRRCQEWTTEFVQRLEDQGLIGPGALEKVQGERDPPTHGIFGYGGGTRIPEERVVYGLEST
ncbi:uncharacterized protein DNG_03917 [Cephalotrichum gorgonifer]|uniref:Uncharacterized protein n=1 Tax=Cephalotrichum gorgonifer TaxID=2041049 RepID=A0AAE8SU11_9PEZI|nr:uncharacterized protein DNG_03917 [Cephalotrichum gorgonifer]